MWVTNILIEKREHINPFTQNFCPWGKKENRHLHSYIPPPKPFIVHFTHHPPREAALFPFLAREDNSVKPTAARQSGITEQLLMSCSAALRPQCVSHA